MKSLIFITAMLLSFMLILQTSFDSTYSSLSFPLACLIGAVCVILLRKPLIENKQVEGKFYLYALLAGILYAGLKLSLKAAVFNHQLMQPSQETLEAFIIFGLSTFLIMPFVEELFFRGILFDDIKRKLGLKVAIVLTSLGFIGIHLPGFDVNPVWQSILVMLPGVFIYVYFRLKTNNFLVSTVAHVTHNITIFALLSLFGQ